MSRTLLGVLTIAVAVAGLVVTASVVVKQDGSDEPPSTAQAKAPRDVQPGLPGALLVEYTRSAPPGWDAAVTPLSSATLSELPGLEPLDLGYQGGVLASPDGRLVAVSSWDPPDASFVTTSSGVVTLVDLHTWQPVGVIESARGVMPAGWSEDGTRLYGARNYCAEPADQGACPGGWERELWAFDVDQPTARRIVALDFESARWHFHGDRAVTIGVRTDTCCGIEPQGDPFVTVVNVDSGEIEAEIALPDMLIGQPRHWLGDTTMYASYHPATALSPDGALLYVVDPVEDEVRVVDLQRLVVTETMGFAEERSGLSRIGGWLLSHIVDTAEAKGNPTHSRQAQVTPDGRYLVISGMQAREEPPLDGRRHWTERPAGLVVVDLTTREVVLRADGVGRFEVSADGRWLLGTGAYYDEAFMDEHGNGGTVASGLTVIDLATLDVGARRWPGEDVAVVALSPDGRYAYIRTDGPGMKASRSAPPPKPPCGPDCWQVHALDLERGEVIASRPLGESEGIASLTSPR